MKSRFQLKIPPVFSNAESPIFIFGISPRSGTNYLFNLLIMHPDCAPFPAFEDYLLMYSRMLDKYSTVLEQIYIDKGFHPPKNTQEVIKTSLGFGLNHMINHQAPGKKIVLKTPQPNGLENMHDYFPNAKILILLRDGRSTSESMVKSFNWTYKESIELWSKGAEHILQFQKSYPYKKNYRIVHYEDLILNFEEELSKVLKFLGLSLSNFNFAGAKDLPLIGSSDTVQKNNNKWIASPLPPKNMLVKRYANWPEKTRKLFIKQAKTVSEKLGYPLIW